MITKSDVKKDLNSIYEIINDASIAYKGIIPADRWKEPYMPIEELTTQINEGVEFWNYEENNKILGVMGIQFKNDATLIRHAYVRTAARQKGIGGKLLAQLTDMAETPILIGTWRDASWAISFYKKHGFRQLSDDEKNKLLKIYWSIPERQVETSIVLASEDWKSDF
ncbi:GNAT family N-acetyltransferase [Maribacter sp. MAR_2009_72]|uniref:GNAT family N-acetyltransferase n=1 Tax=Maribacter sp. MAR_2009_72 TaxID=1250050 RepID=UPI00119C3758|nr:GNAT family N-acetyltransferase [Maribacter sp. MAR_2009_72]TVZ15611.1 N-acetylglutamate synthase-like GNAT family acetyltransferase [Maribacter sp. MAR_2009_72]